MEACASVEGIFSDPNWKPFSKAMNDARGYSPNRGYYNAVEKLAAVVVERSKSGDFAFSKAAQDDLLAAADKPEKVAQAFVVLRERPAGKVLVSLPAAEVAQRLSGHEPISGKFGAYWWIATSFYPPGTEPEDFPW